MLLHVQLDGSERVIALSEFEEKVVDGTLGPETPVRAEPLTGDRWVPARELEIYRGLRASPDVLVRQALASPAVPWFTAILVGIELRIFLWTHGTPPNGWILERFVKFTPSIVEEHEYWRLLTYGFLHKDLTHVVMNMLLIAYLGIALEGVLGSLSLAVLFASSVFWGGVLSTVFLPDLGSLGASGGDFGFLAAAAVFGLRYATLLPPRARPRFGGVMAAYIALELLSALFATDGHTDNWGHIGGLIAGGTMMVFLRPNVSPAWKARNRRVSLVAILLALGAVLAMARLPIPLVAVQEDGLGAARPSWWAAGWAATGERAWVSPVGARLVAITVHHDEPVTVDGAVAALLDAWREVDPASEVRTQADVVKEGVPGRHLRIGYHADGRGREVDAAVFVRGRYEHRLVLDVPAAQGRVANLWERMFGGLTLPVPADVAEARAATGGWRGRLRQAEGAAQIGDVVGARALIDTARGEAPGEPAPTEALLELLQAYPDAGVPTHVDEALAAWPEDRRILEAGVRALVAAGQVDAARSRLEARMATAPEDRKLKRLHADLFEEPGQR